MRKRNFNSQERQSSLVHEWERIRDLRDLIDHNKKINPFKKEFGMLFSNPTKNVLEIRESIILHLLNFS